METSTQIFYHEPEYKILQFIILLKLNQNSSDGYNKFIVYKLFKINHNIYFIFS